MKEITEPEARELVHSSAAGWYAAYANPPIVHDKQIVVTIGEKHYLCNGDEIEITPAGIHPDIGKILHNIDVKNEELCKMILEDIENYKKIDLDGIPVFSTGKRSGPFTTNNGIWS